MKWMDLFYFGVPVLALIVYFIGRVQSDFKEPTVNFWLATLIFGIYGFVMFIREIIRVIGEEK